MTAQYPPASGDGYDDTSEQGAADLSYADVVSPRPAQAPDPQPAERKPDEQAQQTAAAVARTYSWPTPPSPRPVEPSEVDSVDALPAVSTMDTDPAADDSESAMDADMTVSELDLAPSMVDGVGSVVSESAPEPESATPQEKAADSESEDPAVARMRAVQGRLGELDDLPIGEHPARYEELHAELTGALAQIDRGPDSQA